MTNPVLKRIADEQAIVDDINAILGGHGNAVAVGREDITINDKSVSDLVKREPKLSDSIIDRIWPSVRCARVYHYTSHEAAESILGSGIFRLANIEKRLNDGEIVTFCKTHKLDGLSRKEPTGRAVLSDWTDAAVVLCVLHRVKSDAGGRGILLEEFCFI